MHSEKLHTTKGVYTNSQVAIFSDYLPGRLSLTTTSSAVFLLPIYFAVIFGNLLTIFLATLVLIGSVVFHSTQSKLSLFLDRILAGALVTNNFLLVNASSSAGFFLTLVLLLSLPAGFFYFKALTKDYELNHSYWHLIASLVTSICIFASVL